MSKNPIAIYGGSFNPMHIGHLNVIHELLKRGYDVEVMLSPQNPLKRKSELYDFELRKRICEDSIFDYFGKYQRERVSVNTIEDKLPKPSFTYQTLEHLEKTRPDDKFFLAFGTDVINSFDRWEGFEKVKEYPIIHIFRPGNGDIKENKELIKDTIISDIEMSSTQIRKWIEERNWDMVDKNMSELATIKMRY